MARMIFTFSPFLLFHYMRFGDYTSNAQCNQATTYSHLEVLSTSNRLFSIDRSYDFFFQAPVSSSMSNFVGSKVGFRPSFFWAS